MKIKQVAIFVAIFLLVAASIKSCDAEEGLHAYLGMAYHDEKLDTFKQENSTISTLIGEAELEYEFSNGTKIFFRHNSSMQQNDTGLNMIGIKARLF